MTHSNESHLRERILNPRCCYCGHFTTWDCDRGTIYGCADPEDPEPYDEEYFCKKCAEKEYRQCLKDGLQMHNYWQKPDFQLKAMRELGIVEKNYNLVYESK